MVIFRRRSWVRSDCCQSLDAAKQFVSARLIIRWAMNAIPVGGLFDLNRKGWLGCDPTEAAISCHTQPSCCPLGEIGRHETLGLKWTTSRVLATTTA